VQKILQRRVEILATPENAGNSVRVKTEIELEFELELIEEIKMLYKRENCTAEIGKEYAKKLLLSPKYQGTIVQKYRFCHVWWSAFCKRHGYTRK